MQYGEVDNGPLEIRPVKNSQCKNNQIHENKISANCIPVFGRRSLKSQCMQHVKAEKGQQLLVEIIHLVSNLMV
jgi:hypothetical protein